jgi:NAD(P)-dependent dehydrogenase (short-subunit alcohol dehydrogenase family)
MGYNLSAVRRAIPFAIAAVISTVPSDALFRLDGKVAAIVGAGSGIGEAVAEGAAALGATVACLDANASAAQSVSQRIGGRTTAAALDIRDARAVSSAFDDVVRQHGRLDVVVCTPAINVRKSILQFTGEDFDRVVTLNLKGNFNVLQAAGRLMTAARAGSIVFFSSIRGQVVEPRQSAYAMSKGGIVQLVRAAAAEFGPYNVRVNAVAPGIVDTPLTAQIKADQDWYAAYANKSVFKRWAQPREMVGPTLFLASDAASYVTGTVLFADGGWTAVDGRYSPPDL